MKIEVGKREVFTFIVGIFLIAGLFFVYAYGSSPAQPTVFGHTLNEIDGITCGTGQAVTRNATGWGCVNVGGGNSGFILSGPYSATGPSQTTFIGNKKICFLTAYDGFTTNSGETKCYLQNQTGQWILEGYRVDMCTAYCLD